MSDYEYVTPPPRRLLGIITKKDVLRHIAQLEKKDPSNIRFHWQCTYTEHTMTHTQAGNGRRHRHKDFSFLHHHLLISSSIVFQKFITMELDWLIWNHFLAVSKFSQNQSTVSLIAIVHTFGFGGKALSLCTHGLTLFHVGELVVWPIASQFGVAGRLLVLPVRLAGIIL